MRVDGSIAPFNVQSQRAARRPRLISAAWILSALVIAAPVTADAWDPVADLKSVVTSGFHSVKTTLGDLKSKIETMGTDATDIKNTTKELQKAVNAVENVSDQAFALMVHGESLIQYYAEGEAHELQAFLDGASGCSQACETFRNEFKDFVIGMGDAATVSTQISSQRFGDALPDIGFAQGLSRIDFGGMAAVIDEVPGIMLFPAFKLLAILEMDPNAATPKRAHEKVMAKIAGCGESSCSEILSKSTQSFAAAKQGFIDVPQNVQAFAASCFQAVQPDVIETMQFVETSLSAFGLLARVFGGLFVAVGETSIQGASVGVAAGANATAKIKTNLAGQYGQFLRIVGDMLSSTASWIGSRIDSCGVQVNQEVLICMAAETSKGANSPNVGEGLINFCQNKVQMDLAGG